MGFRFLIVVPILLPTVEKLELQIWIATFDGVVRHPCCRELANCLVVAAPERCIFLRHFKLKGKQALDLRDIYLGKYAIQ